MEKISIELKKVEPQERYINGKMFLVEQYISRDVENKLIKFYMDTYFSTETFEGAIPEIKPLRNYIAAERVLQMSMIDLLSNIDISTLDFDLFIAHVGFNTISSNLVNYDEFRNNLDRVVSIIEKQLELSQTITTLKEQLYTFLAELPTKFDIEGMKTQLSSLATEVKDSPLSPLLVESVKQPKKTTKTKNKKAE